MKINKIFALLLAAIMLLSIFTGCNTTTPVGTNPSGSVGTGEHVGSDETGTTSGTEKDPAGNDSISSPTTSPSETACAHMWTQTESEATKAEYEAYIGGEDTVPVDKGYIATYWKTVRSCSHCNETETVVQRRDVVDPNYKPDDGSGETTEPTIPDPDEGDKECQHQYETKTVAPTCTAKGYTQYTCSKCNASYTSDYTNATGHKWSDWNVTKAATCTANGSKSRTCANCGKVETETIVATGHSFGSWSTTKQATCDTNGVKTRKCSKCSKEETETIAATGHNWDEGKVTTVPTSCSDMGIKTYTCKTCGKTKTEQIKGNHTFGNWYYEEYTYEAYSASGRLKTYTSHRKVRICSKCGYKETGGTPDHICTYGCNNHTETVIEKATCTKGALYRSTCNICGWHEDYRSDETGAHSWQSEHRHLTDYGPYTNELDAEVSTCTVCGKTSVSYTYGEGWSDYNRYDVKLTFAQGNAEEFSPENPTHQMVRRDFVYDANGYVKQFTFHWWYNGKRYSQVIKCDKASMIAWFAEYGLNTSGNESYVLIPSGSSIVPHKITYTG